MWDIKLWLFKIFEISPVSNVPDPSEGAVGFIAILYTQVSNL